MSTCTEHVPLRIVAEMGQAVATYGDPIHMDGILAVAAYRDLPPEARAALPDFREAAVDFPLPLARWECDASIPDSTDDSLCVPGTVRLDGVTGARIGRIWGWRASRESAEWLAQGVRETTKKQPIRDMTRWSDDDRLSISGPMKARRIAHPTRFAHRIEWWACGDEAEVRRLLSEHVTHIGKLHHLGMGRVLRWTVERVERDESVERADGTLARRMPAGYGGRVDWAEWGGVRAPYHHQSRQTWVIGG